MRPRPDSSSRTPPAYGRGECGIDNPRATGTAAGDVDQAAARGLARPPAFLGIRLADAVT